jgi:Family of unknown function (DUF5681)
MNRRGKGRIGDYERGYGKPPPEHQFPPNTSGNPRGRPKGRKTIGKMLQDALQRKVKIQENGRTRTISVQEYMIINLVNDAARRDLKAIRAVFALQTQYVDSSETVLDLAELHPEDEAIVRDYIAKLAFESGAEAGKDATQSHDADCRSETGAGK